jgi:hypothetical protein
MGAGPGRPPGILLKLLPPDNISLLATRPSPLAGGETVAALDDSAEGWPLPSGPRPRPADRR